MSNLVRGMRIKEVLNETHKLARDSQKSTKMMHQEKHKLKAKVTGEDEQRAPKEYLSEVLWKKGRIKVNLSLCREKNGINDAPQ